MNDLQREQLYYMSYLALLTNDNWAMEFGWAMIHCEWVGLDQIIWC